MQNKLCFSFKIQYYKKKRILIKEQKNNDIQFKVKENYCV